MDAGGVARAAFKFRLEAAEKCESLDVYADGTGIGPNSSNLYAMRATRRALQGRFSGVAEGPICKMFCRDTAHTGRTPAARDQCAPC